MSILHKTAILLVAAMFAYIPATAQNTEDVQQKKTAACCSWALSCTTDFAFYPLSDYAAGSDHFAVLTGPYSALEGRLTPHAKCTIPVPFGSNPLVKGNTVVIDYALEITPVSLMPKCAVTFTPAAFMSIGTGASFGTGWQFAGIKGMAVYDSADRSYSELTSFKKYFADFYVNGILQFDTAAFWPGDWHHIVALACWQTEYSCLTGVENGIIWQWLGTGNRANGWFYDTNFLIGYRMPFAVSMAALSAQCIGHYDGADYSRSEYPGFDGGFMTANITPMIQLTFGKHDMMYATMRFASRRSFKEDHSSYLDEPLLTSSGREWYFDRIAFSWTHTF